MSTRHVHYEEDPDLHVKLTNLEEEQTEQYAIWTPVSWSDNESPPLSPSTGKTLSNLPRLCEQKINTQVPSDLMDVIERQDAVIERLTTWCQTLEDQAVTHRMKLIEQERAKEDYNTFCSKMNAELSSLKSAARRKAKEHSVEANILYERMQAKVDARVAAWCSRHEGISNRSGSPKQSTRPKDAHRAHGKATGRNGTPHTTRVSSKSSLGTVGSATALRTQTRTAARGDNSPRNTIVADPSPRTSPSKRESRSTNLSPELRELNSSLGSGKCADKCFERRASPDATRPSKRRGQKGSSASSQIGTLSSATSLRTTPMSSFNSTNHDIQKAIRDAAARTLATVNSNATLAEPASPRVVPSSWSAPSRTTQISRRNGGGVNRRPMQGAIGEQKVGVANSPLRQAMTQQTIVGQRGPSDSSSAGQGFKFMPRSVSPPQLASGSNVIERHGSPSNSQHPHGHVRLGAPGDKHLGQKSHQPSRSPVQGRPVSRPMSPRSSFVPPRRGTSPQGRVVLQA